MPARPNPSIQPDETSQAVREATALVARAVAQLRDARDTLDEASEVAGLPEGLAGSLGTTNPLWELEA